MSKASKAKRKRVKKERGRNADAHVVCVPREGSAFGGVTSTERRDDGVLFCADICTDVNNRTNMLVQCECGHFYLTGREARTLQRLLNKHYAETGRSTPALGA